MMRETDRNREWTGTKEKRDEEEGTKEVATMYNGTKRKRKNGTAFHRIGNLLREAITTPKFSCSSGPQDAA